MSLHYLVKCRCLTRNNRKQDDFCTVTTHFKSASSGSKANALNTAVKTAGRDSHFKQ